MAVRGCAVTNLPTLDFETCAEAIAKTKRLRSAQTKVPHIYDTWKLWWEDNLKRRYYCNIARE